MIDPEFAGKLSQENDSDLIAKGGNFYKNSSCIGCHGEMGKYPTDSNWPNLAGQPTKYLYQQIVDIRDGNRNNGSSSLMAGSIKNLENEKAYLIALYLSNL
tara:strand:+ start:90 stop:392 length:303 start_codon:yes stop_codon:yes gene_type:complete